ncbi:TerB family tellurite resistance protein [Sulfuriflexus mobilis]|uniref:tellurite resistance TerB family protein n=1 Tax=Sulfuriflexus mobilis TaxID=1811807 RepID=UPI000F8183C7|nr:TerB family tellurite resistance protein [Sulfuriflexus mobilis]
MLNSIRDFFQQRVLSSGPEPVDARSLRVATATLMFEMAQADDHIEARERDAITGILCRYFQLDAATVAELLELAAETARHAVCLQEFTRLLNEHFSQGEKQQVVEMLWQVALSDAVLDKYEEAFVRQIADLLYVPHTAFIAAKHRAMGD